MSSGAANALLVLGAVLQALGFALALIDLRAGRKAVLGYMKRPQVLEVETAYESEVAFPVGMMAGGEEPTVEERIERLEEEIVEERLERIEAIREGKKQLTQRTDQVIATTERATRREIAALAELIASPPSWRAWWAIGLFLVGLTLMTVGSIS